MASRTTRPESRRGLPAAAKDATASLVAESSEPPASIRRAVHIAEMTPRAQRSDADTLTAIEAAAPLPANNAVVGPTQ